MILSNTDNLAQVVRPRKPSFGYVTLKIDVSNMGISAIENLTSCLRQFLFVTFIGGDTLYASGNISTKDYNKIWRTIDLFNCNVIC